MAKSAETALQKLTFEQAFEELETIVESLETERQPLENLTKIYLRGMQLLRRCQELLDSARQRIEEVRVPELNGSLDASDPTKPSPQPSTPSEDDSDDEIRLF